MVLDYIIVSGLPNLWFVRGVWKWLFERNGSEGSDSGFESSVGAKSHGHSLANDQEGLTGRKAPRWLGIVLDADVGKTPSFEMREPRGSRNTRHAFDTGLFASRTTK